MELSDHAYSSVFVEAYMCNPNNTDHNHLCVGEFPDNTALPAAVQSALYSKINPRLYPEIDSNLSKELREKLASYMQVYKENILLTAGSFRAIRLILDTFANTRDSVCSITPTYGQFFRMSTNLGMKCISIPHTGNETSEYILDKYKTMLRQAPCIQVCYICTPNNPTGTVVYAKQIQELLEEFPSIMFLVDLAYAEMWELKKANDICRLTNSFKNICVIRTFSKAFGLAGLRMGYVVSHVDNITSLKRLCDSHSPTEHAKKVCISALDSLDGYKKIWSNMKIERVGFAQGLLAKGWTVVCTPEHNTINPGNYIFARPPNDAAIKNTELSCVRKVDGTSYFRIASRARVDHGLFLSKL